ncbi:MAG: hypothetical protein QG608_3735 [Actinomycetota bacterium]|nr:hypothetical protein [Actinomycetota bacterium]
MAAVPVAVLVLAVLFGPSPFVPSPAAAGAGIRPTAPDLSAGTQYLVAPDRLRDGHYHEVVAGSGFADWGLTIDTAFALVATGARLDVLSGIVEFIDSGSPDGTGSTIDLWTGIGTEWVSGGSLGKQALLAQAVGRNPRSFGGHDLIGALSLAVCQGASSAPDTSCAGRGNYRYATSVFGQSLGIIAQLRAGDDAVSPLDHLARLQHSDGSFPSLIPSTGDSDIDSTAMAAMALDLAPDRRAAVDRALAWIAARQLSDGGFTGPYGESVNSAALALQGLSLRRETYAGPIAAAASFLASQQNADGGFCVVAGQPGSDVRASAQALGGATGISFADLYIDLASRPSPTVSPTVSPTGGPSPGPTGGPGPAGPPGPSGPPGPPRNTSSPRPTAARPGAGSPAPAPARIPRQLLPTRPGTFPPVQAVLPADLVPVPVAAPSVAGSPTEPGTAPDSTVRAAPAARSRPGDQGGAIHGLWWVVLAVTSGFAVVIPLLHRRRRSAAIGSVPAPGGTTGRSGPPPGGKPPIEDAQGTAPKEEP